MSDHPVRVAPLPREEWHEKIRDQLDAAQASGRLLNIMPTLATSSRLFKHWLPYASYLFDRSLVEPRHRELAILRVAWLCKAPYEWGGHVRTAERVGLTAEEIKRVIKGPASSGWNTRDRLVLVTVDELVGGHDLTDRTWSSLVQEFDNPTLVELVVTVSQYVATAMVVNALGVESDPGDGTFPAKWIWGRSGPSHA